MSDELWDAVVVGAGPAGSVAAALLAERGWRVLLVEKSAWPRDKACGGCVNAAAVGLLRAAGLGDVLRGAEKLTTMNLHMGKQTLRIPLPEGVAVERREFDARLVEEACARGVTFWPETGARLMAGAGEGCRKVRLARAGTESVVRARMVLACDGLRGTFLAEEPWAAVTRERRVRLGFSTTVERAFPIGMLGMYAGAAGYVGLVRVAENRMHVGAALWPEACNARHGPQGVIDELLKTCGQPLLPEAAEFHGTGPLTVTRATVAGERVLAIGDACGYVEPFTGEGISWAIRGAMEAVRLLPARAEAWDDDLIGAWQERFETTIRYRQRWCRRLRSVLQRPNLAASCVAVARCLPAAPAFLARRISA